MRRSHYVLVFSIAFATVLSHAQSDVEVVVTGIERRTGEQLRTQDATVLDGSHWQLDSDELERAEALQIGFRRYISDRQISPLEVLGIHARSKVERDLYARRWAKLMIDDAERVLAFQRAYDDAVRDLLTDRPLIELAHLPVPADSTQTLLPTDRLAIFISLDCATCDEIWDRVRRVGRRLEGVDVYVLGLQEDEISALHAWANRRGIPPIAVHSKRITLNLDEGLLERVHPRAIEVPVVMRRRGDRLEPLDPWELR